MTPEKCSRCDVAFPPVPSGQIAAGYARTQTGEYICYPCANRSEAAEFATASQFCAYLSGDGLNITTWPGGFLAKVTYSVERTMCGFGVWYTRTYFDAIAPDGASWYGQSAGPGMFARLRRRKVRAERARR